MRPLLWLLPHTQKGLQLTSSRDIICTLNMPSPPAYRHRSLLIFPKKSDVKNLKESPGSLLTYISHLNYSAAKHVRLGLGQASDWACPVSDLDLTRGWEDSGFLAHVWVGSIFMNRGKGMRVQWAKVIWGPLPILTSHITYIGRRKRFFFFNFLVMRNCWPILMSYMKCFG